jgi:hypothetical protein
MMKILEEEEHPLSFGHFLLIADAHGQGFSKHLGILSFEELRTEGMLP